MGINFTEDRWDRIREDYARWWAKDLKRPLMQLRPKRDPGRSAPRIRREEDARLAVWDLSVPTADIIDWFDYELSSIDYMGDNFPHFSPNFGPGIIAAFLGADVKVADDTTWFLPKEERPIKDIRFEYDADNRWLKRMRDIYRVAGERWGGKAQAAMTDLGGNLDLLAAWRPGEGLLYDLYDHPEEVKRLTWEAHRTWWRYYEEFTAIAGRTNAGYTAWLPIFSDGPYYVLQCDFSYMISTEMFDEFVRPELAATCKRLKNSIYHLDGVRALPHLDSLLSIPELGGIQWVFGEGQPGVLNWPHVYKKVRDAGKLLYLSCPLGEFDIAVERLGTAEGIFFNHWETSESMPEVREFLEKYKAI